MITTTTTTTTTTIILMQYAISQKIISPAYVVNSEKKCSKKLKILSI